MRAEQNTAAGNSSSAILDILHDLLATSSRSTLSLDNDLKSESVYIEVDFNFFKSEIWPTIYKKVQVDLDSAIVFAEILSVIKYALFIILNI